jgi:hypothetical protein
LLDNRTLVLYDMLMIASTAASPWSTPPQIYRQFFTPAECKMLDAAPQDSALSEISLIRILLMRALAAAHRLRTLSIKQHIDMLIAFSGAGLILASLVRYHHDHFGRSNPLLDALADMDPDDL